jgi:DNA repair protein RecN (Recombination protein N)
MLEELHVQNYALIDRVHLEFAPGFNVLSGETGAGKSILIGALSLLHGARADTSAIRTGSDEAMVSGVFRVAGNREAVQWLAERGIEPEDGTILVRRTVKRQGRGQIYIQSAPVTRADLEQLTSLMFDLHGQHEHQSLLSEDNHRTLLDRYAGLEEEANELRERFSELSTLKRRAEKMRASEQERLREIDILQFAVNEIDDADLTVGEEEELDTERRVLSQHEKLFGLLDHIYELTAENRGGSLANLRAARDAMESVVQIDETLSSQASRLADAFYEVEDVAETIRDYRNAMEFSPQRLEACENRLVLIHKLEKKYGATIEDVLRYRDEAQGQLESLDNWEEDKADLEERIKALERDVLSAARSLSDRRKGAAVELGTAVESTVQNLGMAKTSFVVAVEQRASASGRPICGPHGIDSVAFRITPNPGEPLKPLSEIASGGEISRVMLALKTALAEVDHLFTLVFDEIDAGIGGEIALSVGHHLKELAGHKQVLCITHLASIAARADNHITVAKNVVNGRTTTQVDRIAGERRIEEIARMLAGDKDASVSRQHAEELLRKFGAEVAG